jgi:hypothetical protein
MLMKHSISAAVVGPLERWGWAKGKSCGPQTHTHLTCLNLATPGTAKQPGPASTHARRPHGHCSKSPNASRWLLTDDTITNEPSRATCMNRHPPCADCRRTGSPLERLHWLPSQTTAGFSDDACQTEGISCCPFALTHEHYAVSPLATHHGHHHERALANHLPVPPPTVR